MRALNLDFATGRSRLQFSGNVLLGITLLAAAVLAWIFLHAVQERDQWQDRLNGLQTSSRAHSSTAQSQVARSPAQVAELKSANQVIDHLALPWDRLFNELEASVDEHVVLLGVEPDVAKGRLVLTAEARNLGAMLAYEKRLADSAMLRDVHVQSHQVQVQDAQRPVRFVVGALWMHGIERGVP